MPQVPDGAPQPKDRPKKKSADARKAEADGFIDIEQCGVPLRIPLGEKVPLAAYMAFKDGDEMRGTELLLGQEQWQAFMDANPTVGDFAEIGEKLTEVLGN
jgi:hypothetical protein